MLGYKGFPHSLCFPAGWWQVSCPLVHSVLLWCMYCIKITCGWWHFLLPKAPSWMQVIPGWRLQCLSWWPPVWDKERLSLGNLWWWGSSFLISTQRIVFLACVDCVTSASSSSLPLVLCCALGNIDNIGNIVCPSWARAWIFTHNRAMSGLMCSSKCCPVPRHRLNLQSETLRGTRCWELT